MNQKAAGKPTCYQVGGWKTEAQLDTKANTLRELKKLWEAIAECEDELWKTGGLNPDAAPTIHKIISGKSGVGSWADEVEAYESEVSDKVDTDSEWEEGDEDDVSDTVDTDSEWDEDGGDTSGEEKEEGTEWTTPPLVAGDKRANKKVVRFSDEVEHLPSAWGGYAGSNNGYTRGREVDAGHTTADLVAEAIIRKLALMDRT